MSIRIVIADEHTLILDALGQTLAAVQGFEVVALVNDGRRVLATIHHARPTVAVVNTGMTGTDCLQIAREVSCGRGTCGVVIVTTKPTRAMVDRAVKAGALGVVPKHARMADLVSAVRSAAAGCLTIRTALHTGPAKDEQVLSDREREILRLTVEGASVKEIAGSLFLTVGTVRNLSSAAIRKLNGRSRFDAARIAYEQGWL